ncbi:hypothetical protein METBIDRAFT_13678 [Metschnikowia bicuspidata var. bicuspidata NRRL YB-4993]|uniref:Uncharacterized protein n=1 Tax=Metschnikowia bicuspidata var. bicuspidata NRRL YB-4993 TaxID=869754 RepID=A0A1A0H644_9ASCO|nr:hypothetical protein METBIDRAFT_13678 [Metschnikowia bicuspidata var. bicuspidata NRRL YB-4993]OBA19388.1 hypothetical protein METBIDRAFT_13678 [Metschnikowia bicuspidata var. bicuspidata NRRL YB-4993]
MITATNVRFLAKEPIVGLKIFDGEKLRKRLQVTFSSEGNFNMFANKINQWLGLNVVASYEAPDLQLANSQQATLGTPYSQKETSLSQTILALNEQIPDQGSQRTGSQYGGSHMFGSHMCASQNAISDVTSSQIAHSQDNMSQFAPFQELSQQLDVSQLSPLGKHGGSKHFPFSQNNKLEEASHNLDAVLLLLSAAAKENTSNILPQYDTSVLSQSTQIWNDSRANVFQYPTASANNTCFTQTTIDQDLTQTNESSDFRQAAPRGGLTQNLKEIPFNPNERKKNTSHSSSSKTKRGMTELLEATIARILEEKKENYVDLSDEELSLKLCRRFKSRTFLMLLKRVENLLE